jgi:hypothetical protein
MAIKINSNKPIKIKPANKGKFTAAAKKAGKTVQQEATAVLKNKSATTLQKKRAQFAKNAAKWSKTKPGTKRTKPQTKPTDAEIMNSMEANPVGPKALGIMPPGMMPPQAPPYKPTRKKKGNK